MREPIASEKMLALSRSDQGLDTKGFSSQLAEPALENRACTMQVRANRAESRLAAYGYTRGVARSSLSARGLKP